MSTRGPGPGALCAAISEARTVAAAGLLESLGDEPIGLSESVVLARWLGSVSRHPALLPQGWYVPPPRGYSVLIGHPPEFERTNFSSLRSRSKWADANEILDGESLLLAYASPVDRATAMIGDFMVTLYGGSEGHVREHISRCLAVTAAIAERVTVGMEFRDLYGEAMELMEFAGVRNDTQSTTDRTGALNIGHTVPWSDGQHDDRIWSAIRDGEETDIANLISGARAFITGAARTRVSPNVAFTVEPQLVSAGCPQVTFHVIVCICNGEKHVHADFLRLFEKFGMVDYLPPNVVRQVGG